MSLGQAALQGRVLATGGTVPLYVPVLFLGWGIVLWLTAGRKIARNPRGEFRSMAEKRATSRVVRGLGGSGDPDVEFDSLWRSRWLFVAIPFAYLAMVAVFFVKALL